jgi:hypothetical protein
VEIAARGDEPLELCGGEPGEQGIQPLFHGGDYACIESPS